VSEMDPHQAELMAADHCILVDCEDRPIGSAAKQQCHLMTEIKAGKGLHRAFSVFLFNEKNELLLQRRAGVKPTFPNRWTNTCCSHPLANRPEEADETDNIGVKNAAIRKLDDELGIPVGTLKPSDFVYLTRIQYCAHSDGKWGEHEVDHLMFCKPSVPICLDNINPNEVSEVKWVSPAQLKEDFAAARLNPTHLTPWFEMIATQMMLGWWENGALDKVMAAGGLGDELRSRVPKILTLKDKPDTQIPEDTPGLQKAQALQSQQEQQRQQ